MRRPSRRSGLAIGLVVVLAIGGGAYAVTLRGDSGCGSGDARVSAGDTRNPLLTPAEMERRPDQRLDRLAAAVGAMPAPFGKVLGGIGFDYDQYLHLAALEHSVGVTTKNNALFAVLSSRLEPRWGIKNTRDPHAWDAGTARFYNLDLRRDDPLEVSSYDMSDGRRVWCTAVGSASLKRDDPVSTQPLADGGLVVLAGAEGHLRLTRLDRADGHVRWQRAVEGVDEGDYVGAPLDDVLVAGGRPQYELADAAGLDETPTRTGISGFHQGSGRSAWTYPSPAGTAAHVLGSVDDAVLVTERRSASSGATGRLFALDPGDGHELWSVAEPAGGQVDLALRGGVVLVRSATTLAGYDASDGSRLWQTPFPAGKQLFPYGFTLDEQPMLDADRVLLAGTEALLAVDVRTGRMQRYPLPTDGINTTFWPYQLIVTPDLIGIVTNTGGLVVARDPA